MLLWVIFARLNEFVLMVCGECLTSYAHSLCKVVILSAFCRIGPTVAYIWRSVANEPKLAKFTQLVYKIFPLMYDVIIIREWFVSLGAV